MATVYTSCCSNHYYDPKIRDNKGQGRDLHFKDFLLGHTTWRYNFYNLFYRYILM